MELIAMGVGLLVNTIVKNKAVTTAVDDFVSESVGWIRSWFGKSKKAELFVQLETGPESPEQKAALTKAIGELLENQSFRKEFERWVDEAGKPNPSMKNVLREKNIVNDAQLDIEGNISIGDKGASQGSFDKKNILKNVRIKGGGDFNLGDSQ